MHKTLHPRDGVDRLYVSRKEGGRRLAGIEDCVDVSTQELENYIKKTKKKKKERLLTAANKALAI